jgi:hypothetical protein
MAAIRLRRHVAALRSLFAGMARCAALYFRQTTLLARPPVAIVTRALLDRSAWVRRIPSFKSRGGVESRGDRAVAGMFLAEN